MYESYENFCLARQATGKYRILPEATAVKGNGVVDFSTNDYLGLAGSLELIVAANLAAQQYGVGSTGSRLLSGNKKVFGEFEDVIARDKGTQAALIFNSGFQANISVLPSLLDQSVAGEKPIVFFDRLNHASLYQGIFLSGAKLVRYHHCSMVQLRNMLEKHRDYVGQKFIVTETLFGMDGDIAPMAEILALAKEYRAFVYLDESHATGVMGNHGFGISTDFDFSDIPHLVMGTFSKALGCSGAYVACSEIIKNYLVNHCPGFVYSTSLSPMIVGAACTAWQYAGMACARRQKLQTLSGQLRNQLQQAGFDTGDSSTNIIPVILGCESAVMQAGQKLLREGIIVSAIRPPTVPPRTSRLRISVTASHTRQDLDRLLSALENL